MTPETLERREEKLLPEAHEPLFVHENTENLRARWQTVQGEFVDDPRGALRDADELVESTMKRLEEIFAEERNRLESDWSKGDVSTEDLRQSLRRYRAFFDRLLAV